MHYQKIYNYFKENPQIKTPFLVVDTAIVQERFNFLQQSFNSADIFYAIKANPGEPVIKMLNKSGSSFDVASIHEIDHCLKLGVSPKNLSFGNTIKKAVDIQAAFEKGIKIFAFDSKEELEKIAKLAPGSKVFCRILVKNDNAMWPLSKKFGCNPQMAIKLLKLAKKLKLVPWGISFHVGSQQTLVTAWDEAFSLSFYIYKELLKNEITLKIINAGGGLPAINYNYNLAPISEFINNIHSSKKKYFKDTSIKILIEPGRYLVADAGIIKTEVILISNKTQKYTKKWVYTDIGVFSGLIETLEESIKYKIVPEITRENNTDLMKVNLAGPTCDSMDIMYKKAPYYLPKDLKIGEKLLVLSTGAYTYSYSSVCFNGFPPLDLYFI